MDLLVIQVNGRAQRDLHLLVPWVPGSVGGAWEEVEASGRGLWGIRGTGPGWTSLAGE